MFPCPCCRYLTFREAPPGTFDICPVCAWIDDAKQSGNPEEQGGLNKVSLSEARENFLALGACTEDSIQDVRPPRPQENPLYGPIRTTLPNTFPDHLLQRAISLAPAQPHEVGWTRESVNDIVHFLNGTDIPIVGGDVYRTEKGEARATYDQWSCKSCQHEKGETWSDYAKRTHEETLEYVNSYDDPEDGSVLYVLVFPK